MTAKKLTKLMMSASLCALAVSTAAFAQDAAPAQDSTQVEEVVVTGTASSAMRKLDASFSITTANLEQIQETAPKSTADLLKIVPGVWVEATGGQSGANVFIRGFPATGDAPFLTMQLDGSPIFPPPSLSFLENSTLFRIDDMVERMEVLRGGPSPIFSNGQSGATVNFIQRKGSQTPHAGIRGTVTDYGEYRVDSYFSGPINEDTTFAVGGFYRTSDGLRETQFPADKGGQISANISHDFGDQGNLTVYGRYTNDKNAFYTAVPLISRDNGNSVSGFPGFDPLKDTLMGNNMRLGVLQYGVGATPQSIRRDMADGRGLDLFVGGSTFDWKFGDWKFSNRMNFMGGKAPTNALFTGAAPVTMASYINSTIASANANAAVVAAAGGAATAGTATYVGGGAVDPSKYVMVAGWWAVDKDLQSFTDEMRLSKEIFEGNTLTVGAYYASYSVKDRWYQGNNMLIAAEPNARLINLTLNNGVLATRNGFVSGTTSQNNASWDGSNAALFVADEWQVNDRIRVDAGLRYEVQKADGTLENTTANVDLDGNLLTLFNNSTTVLNGSFRTVDYKKPRLSWTAGVNYEFTRSLSAFGRINSGYKFPSFDNLRSNTRNIQTVDQYEIGLKTATPRYNAYLTLFANEFEGLIFNRTIVDPVTGGLSIVSSIGGSKAHGVEFEGTVRPIDGFAVDFRGDYQKGEYKNFGANSGNQVVRQPKIQFAVTPNYTFDTGLGDLKVFATYTHVGNRFSDNENLQRLPKYHTIDAGVSFEADNGVTVMLNAQNLTNELGLTEGNARIIGSGSVDNVFLARPIFGRNVSLSVGYKF